MLTEQARVAAIHDKYLWVDAQQATHCYQCSANSACGHRLISKIHEKRSNLIKVMLEDTYQLSGHHKIKRLKAGDTVLIGIEDSLILKISVIFYLIPLVCLIMSALIAEFLGAGENMIILSSFTAMFLSYYLLNYFAQIYEKKHNLKAILIPKQSNKMTVRLL